MNEDDVIDKIENKTYSESEYNIKCAECEFWRNLYLLMEELKNEYKKKYYDFLDDYVRQQEKELGDYHCMGF